MVVFFLADSDFDDDDDDGVLVVVDIEGGGDVDEEAGKAPVTPKAVRSSGE